VQGINNMENNNDVFLSLMLKFLAKLFIPIVVIQLLNGYAISLNMPVLLYGSIPCVLYMVKIMFDIKRIAENIHLFIPNSNCNPPEYNPLYWEIVQTDVLTDKQMELLERWAKGETWKTLGIHPTILSRLCRKYIRHTLKHKEPSPAALPLHISQQRGDN
jgi:hypothetical protein